MLIVTCIFIILVLLKSLAKFQNVFVNLHLTFFLVNHDQGLLLKFCKKVY